MINHVSQLLRYEELNPEQSATGCVIWMHGLGADGHDFVPFAKALNLPNQVSLKFIFPHAPERPVTINQGYVMRAWYDILSLHMDQHADQQGIEQSRQQIIQLIEQQVAQGISTDKIILAGFSQGAVMALVTGLSYPKPLAGCIVLSGYLPYPEETLKKAHPANAKMPIFLAHGVQDQVVPLMLGEITHRALQQYHYSVSWHTYAMPHAVCPEEVQDIREWLIRGFVN